MLRQPKIKLRYCKIAGILAITIIMIFACQPYTVPVGVMGIVHSANQRKIENLRSEIGNVMIFEIRARVRTQAGTQEKSELVTAKITGHKEFAGSVVRVFDTHYGKGGKLVFTNSEGRTLTIRTRPPEQLGVDNDGGLDHFIRGYTNGKFVHPNELRKDGSLANYGFVLESYIAPLISVKEAGS